jgi:hypothetical protein
MYDPLGVRFFTQDPLSEEYSYQSPYVYAANNPIRFIDVLGMGPDNPPVGTTRIYASLNLSWGPQLGAKIGIFKLAGRVANIDRRIKVGLEISPKGDVSFLFECNPKNVVSEVKASAELTGKSISKELDTDEHSVFTENKTTTKNGVLKTIESEKLNEKTTTEITTIEVGIGANVIILGAEVNVGFEHIDSSKSEPVSKNTVDKTLKQEKEVE